MLERFTAVDGSLRWRGSLRGAWYIERDLVVRLGGID